MLINTLNSFKQPIIDIQDFPLEILNQVLTFVLSPKLRLVSHIFKGVIDHMNYPQLIHQMRQSQTIGLFIKSVFSKRVQKLTAPQQLRVIILEMKEKILHISQVRRYRKYEGFLVDPLRLSTYYPFMDIQDHILEKLEALFQWGQTAQLINFFICVKCHSRQGHVFFNQLKNHLKNQPIEKTEKIAKAKILNWMSSHALHLKILNVNSAALYDFPSEIQYFTQLTKLDLSNNHLNSLSVELLNLTKLKELNLRHNRFKTISNTLIPVKNLEVLIISYNQLRKLNFTAQPFLSLKKLDLCSNQFKEFPTEIAYLLALVELNLSYNNLKELSPQIDALVNLEKLNLSHNQLTQVNYFQCLKKLKAIDLSHNQLIELPKSLENATDLQELRMHFNHLTELPEFIKTFTKLTALKINDNLLKIYPKHITKLKQLKDVEIHNNAFNILRATKLKPLKKFPLKCF